MTMIVRTMAKGLLGAGLLCGASILYAQAPRPSSGGVAREVPPGPMRDLVDYVQGQRTTGFLVIQNDHVIIERNWAAPAADKVFASFAYERFGDGALLEDVASAQKSFVSVLVAIAIDKGLIDVEKPVSAYLGQGWSKASPEQESAIRVLDVLTMSSGLDERFVYVAPAGTRFFYNTPVYAATKRILAAASGQSLDAITRDWLTEPAGMKVTAWRHRPLALSGVGNATGLVTSPRDIAAFGTMILKGGIGTEGRRVVSQAGLVAMLTPSATNPAYGRLWWLNGSAYTIRASGRNEGPLVAAAPADMIAAFGALDRRLYIVPSKRLIVVRTGAAAVDQDFDQKLWLRITAALGL
jgi:CubicO group peptidase (beta-lactamase class C family)